MRETKYAERENRNQENLFPDCIEDYIGEENPARVIDAFADGLDMEGLGIRRATSNNTDRQACDPQDLLKMYVYGYFNLLSIFHGWTRRTSASRMPQR